MELMNDCRLNTSTMACSISGGSTCISLPRKSKKPFPKKERKKQNKNKRPNRNWGNVGETMFHASIWILSRIIETIALGHHGIFTSDVFQTTQSNVVSLFIINLPLRYKHSTHAICSNPFSEQPPRADPCTVVIITRIRKAPITSGKSSIHYRLISTLQQSGFSVKFKHLLTEVESKHTRDLYELE